MNIKKINVLCFFAVIIAIIAYVPSLSVPYYLDDHENIVGGNLLNALSFSDFIKHYPMREIPYASFYFINKYFGESIQLNHSVNLLIHLINSVLVFFIAKAIFMIRFAVDNKQVLFASVSAALLFLILPLNTQAVVYLVQRITLFAALFFLASLLSYLNARSCPDRRRAFVLYFFCGVFFVLGMSSKQNVVVLPLVLILFELFYFRSIRAQRLFSVFLAFTATFLALQIFDFVLKLGIFNTLDGLTRETTIITRWEYFTTQLVIMWGYIYKAFFPYPLLLEYPTKLYSWNDWQVWTATFGFLLVAFGITKLKRGQPIIALLLLTYFVCHLVESSFLPITDLAFEHRTYLPNVFLIFAITLALFKLFSVKVNIVGITLLFLVFAFTTHQRLSLWQVPLDFHRHNLTHVGDNSRIYAGVALAYAKEGKILEADHWYTIAIQVGEETKRLASGTVLSYIELLVENEKHGKARRLAATLLGHINDLEIKSKIRATIALSFIRKDNCVIARGLLNKALQEYPLNSRARTLLTYCKE